MIGYESYGFISGCIYYAIAVAIMVSVSILGNGLTLTEVLLICIVLLMLCFKGEDAINASEIDDDE